MMENHLLFARDDASPAGLRVLVVDDDPISLNILSKMLKKCSYEVTTCRSAGDALNLLQERKDDYDIVMSDLFMPDMDGLKLLEQVGLETDLPVILMSADGEASRVMKAVQLGACDYLLKPIRQQELRNMWRHVFRKKMYEVSRLQRFQRLQNGTQNSINIHQGDASNRSHGFPGQLCFGHNSPSPSPSSNSIQSVGSNILHKDVLYGSLLLHNLETRSYESDQEETISLPVGPSTISSSTDISDGSVSWNSQTEFSDSSTSSGSDVKNIAAFDSTFLFGSNPDQRHEE